MRSGTRRVFSHEDRVPVVHIDSDVNEVVSDVDDAELTDNGSVDDKFIDNTVASGDEHEQTDEDSGEHEQTDKDSGEHEQTDKDSGEQDEVHSDLPDRQPSRLPSKKVANITSSKAQGYDISSPKMSILIYVMLTGNGGCLQILATMSCEYFFLLLFA